MYAIHKFLALNDPRLIGMPLKSISQINLI